MISSLYFVSVMVYYMLILLLVWPFPSVRLLFLSPVSCWIFIWTFPLFVAQTGFFCLINLVALSGFCSSLPGLSLYPGCFHSLQVCLLPSRFFLVSSVSINPARSQLMFVGLVLSSCVVEWIPSVSFLLLLCLFFSHSCLTIYTTITLMVWTFRSYLG